MNTQDLKIGMSVEYHRGLAEVVAIDSKAQTAVIQRRSDNHKLSVNVGELVEDHQLDSDINMHYWGC